MDFVQYKCPCCGAALRFSGETQKLTCDNCSNTYDIETLEKLAEIEGKEGEDDLSWEGQKEAIVAEKTADGRYICPSCGGEIEADEHTVSTKCPYCLNVVVIKETASGEFKPDAVLPFRINGDKAKELLEGFCRGKKLLPKNFRDKSYLKDLKGYYVPYWLFDCGIDADMSFNGTRTRVWSDMEYNYVETSYYLINREGLMDFYHVPVDGSIKMADEITESIEPFDFKDLKEFNPAFLAGYETEKYDIVSDKAKQRAKERIYNSAEEQIRNTVNGFDSVTLKYRSLHSNDGKVHYVLLPVWLFETVYEGKNYQFAINGQTGKMTGELPVDKGAFRSFVIKYTAVGTAILSLIGILMGGVLR